MAKIFENRMNAQFYYTEELDKDTFKINVNPYKAELYHDVLRKVGFLFYRDDAHAHGAFFTPLDEVVDGFYAQILLNCDGTIFKPYIFNKPVRINWMTTNLVNRVFL